MLKKVKEYVMKWHMLEKNDKVIVGVSGGADSICLLFVLLELQKSIPFEMIVVHVNHGLRGISSDEDEAFVKRICHEKDILCITYSENVELIAKNRKQSTEEAGRDVRRAIFYRVLEKYGGTKIALAHHKNDNVETFFMNLSRGTGLKGLGGIRPVTDRIIRPLLCLERYEIEQYLEEREIPFRTDQTNFCDEYTRNRIRNHIIPYFEKEVNSRTVSHVSDAMEQLLKIQTFMEEQRDICMQKCLKRQNEKYYVLQEFFQTVPSVLQPLILKEIIVKISGKEKDISAIHLETLQSLFQKQVGRKVNLPYELEACRVYEGISIYRKTIKKCKMSEIKVSFEKEKEQKIVLQNVSITCRILENISNKYTQKGGNKWFDYDIMQNVLSIRTRQPGDYITIHPDGRTQKLKEYFINEKIPQEKRDEILLVADGSHIMWIEGYRTNCMYQVKENTKHILEIQIKRGESHGRDN